MKKAYLTTSAVKTQKLGEDLAKKILETGSSRGAIVIGLEGNLGGGKTTFLQGFAKGLGIQGRVNSPTFVIQKRFKVKSPRFKNFYHLDCYRLKNPEELFSFGFREVIADPENIVAVEWADKIKKILPRKTIWLKFKFVDDKTRHISMGRDKIMTM